MNVGFLRRYTIDPGLAEIAKIEGVVTLDREPPPAVVGTGTGTTCIVGEFENGPFDTPLEMVSGTDVESTFGGFGYTYDGVPANHPCARGRKADGATSFEYWNGNGAIALRRKSFTRLVLARVDTSVGEVQFTRLASLTGSTAFSFDLEPAQTLVFDIGGGDVTATFTAAVATTTSAAGVYPSTFTGGETMTVAIEGIEYDVVFLATDQTQAQVIDRINLTLGYTAMTDIGGAQTRFDGKIRGTLGEIQIVSIDVLVATATGFAAGAAINGTGNVGNIDKVTSAEVNSVVNAASPTTFVDRAADGAVRIYTTSGQITVKATSTATGFGFPTETLAEAATGVDGTIPAGTRVKTAGNVEFVTMQDLSVAAGDPTPASVKVRHALDDGTGVATGVSTVNVVSAPIALGAFGVTNALPISAALTEAQIDARYSITLGKTQSVNNVAREINIILSARQSNSIRNELRQNALDASANGCVGRIAVVCPPLGTTRLDARSTTTQPGVGAYRDQRVTYAYPGARINVPEIALRGLAGGAGFTVDGNIDVHPDSVVATLMSRLPPEENIGQETDYLAGIIGLEAGNPDIQDMTIGDYTAFKAAGICALRVNNGVVFVQSAVTSVDPVTKASQKNIARRRMADFIQDTIAITVLAYSKKLATRERKSAIVSTISSFLSDLKGTQNSPTQRIDDFLIDARSGNTPNAEALGIFRIQVKVKTLASIDVIVIDAQIGETVEITETTA